MIRKTSERDADASERETIDDWSDQRRGEKGDTKRTRRLRRV
jgi:hypothetical protein